MAPTRQKITPDKYNLENVDNFIYVSVQLTKNGNELEEIKWEISSRMWNMDPETSFRKTS